MNQYQEFHNDNKRWLPSRYMSYKITDNTVTFELKATQKSNLFLREFAEQVVSTAQPLTPLKDNFLRKDVLKQVLALKGKIVWNKKYASYQERGMRADGSKKVRKYTTPGTGAHFARDSVKTVAAIEGQIMRKVGLI